ncbi:MAG: hypothetical protein GF353_14175 [Candidatus Lokiarchaeota archaeon]|nr:hypothetical protein [Candidatus Lokiarchaeota archaeon]
MPCRAFFCLRALHRVGCVDRVVRLKKGSVNAVEHKGSFTGGSGNRFKELPITFFIFHIRIGRGGWLAW